MDTTSDDEFWAMFDLEDKPVFETAADLARFSIQSHQGMLAFRKTELSRGHLRFTGFGVDAHEADADRVFQAGIAFQRLLAAIGSSLSGARKTISATAEKLTRLKLDASPVPGSIVLNLVSGSEPEKELRQGGALIDSGDQLIDRTFTALRSILEKPESIQDGETIGNRLIDLGPQTSLALRNFATAVSESHFDVEVRWEQPLKPVLIWAIPTEGSLALKRIIEGRSLDEVPVTLTGSLHTVSLANSWVMLSHEYGRIVLDMRRMDGVDRDALPSGQEVKVQALVATTQAPGQGERRSFHALSVEPVTEPSEPA